MLARVDGDVEEDQDADQQLDAARAIVAAFGTSPVKER
jgi:hypothetical protein